jgi:RNA polymerase sigma-70 factor (ECF subfamily)
MSFYPSNDDDVLAEGSLDRVSKATIEDAARAAKAGGRRELNQFLDALRPLVCRWALLWTGSADSAEDVAQAVLMRVHRSFGEYSEASPVTTWAYRITRNMLIDHDRVAGREQARRDILEREVSHLVRHRPDALDLLAGVDLLVRFMEDLSPQQRAALDLVELQGFSQTEAAEMLEVSPATLRVHLHRARKAIEDGVRHVEAPDSKEGS